MKTIATCRTCGEKLIGEDLLRIGNSYYCQSDYSKQMDRDENRRMREANRKLSRLLIPFDNKLSLSFTDDWEVSYWELQNITISGKTITTGS